MHPHLLKFLRLYKYNAQTVIEGMLFGDERRHDAVRTTGLGNQCIGLGDLANTATTSYRYEYHHPLRYYYSK